MRAGLRPALDNAVGGLRDTSPVLREAASRVAMWVEKSRRTGERMPVVCRASCDGAM